MIVFFSASAMVSSPANIANSSSPPSPFSFFRWSVLYLYLDQSLLVHADFPSGPQPSQMANLGGTGDGATATPFDHSVWIVTVLFSCVDSSVNQFCHMDLFHSAPLQWKPRTLSSVAITVNPSRQTRRLTAHVTALHQSVSIGRELYILIMFSMWLRFEKRGSSFVNEIAPYKYVLDCVRTQTFGVEICGGRHDGRGAHNQLFIMQQMAPFWSHHCQRSRTEPFFCSNRSRWSQIIIHSLTIKTTAVLHLQEFMFEFALEGKVRHNCGPAHKWEYEVRRSQFKRWFLFKIT